jgi:LysR family hydrogen peroxide-inducible transcriptional activator
MNLRDLKYLVAVAETRHFGKAAKRCFVSQPTLSGQIRKLEQELGVTLFERTNRSVEVTPIGESILVHARQIIEQADIIEQLANAQQDPLAGPLRIGAIPTLSPYLMPLVLAPLKKRVPQMKLVLSEEMTDSLTRRLLHHEIDAALLATAVNEPGLASIPLFEEPFWVAYPRKHKFYTQERITLRDLDNENMLLLAEGHCLADQAMAVCRLETRQAGGDQADLRAASLETLLQLVRAGYGITLVPALALQGSWASGSGVVTHPLNIQNARRRVSLIYRESFPRLPALRAFCDVVRSHLPNTVKPAARKSR